MSTIRTTCPVCGDDDVLLYSEDVTVMVCRSNSTSNYSFMCPTCDGIVIKPAEPRVVDLLISTGVRVDIIEIPLEMEESHSGPPISHDDIIELHFAMRSDDWLEKLLNIGSLNKQDHQR